MTLTLITAHGELTLGTAPPTKIACVFCGAPAQLASVTDERTVSACVTCTENAMHIAALMVDTPGSPA